METTTPLLAVDSWHWQKVNLKTVNKLTSQANTKQNNSWRFFKMKNSYVFSFQVNLLTDGKGFVIDIYIYT